MNFDNIIQFFKSWGMYPRNEPTDEYNPDAIYKGINKPCYIKMQNEAENLYGKSFASFCISVIESDEEMFYLDISMWDDLKEKYENFKL